MYDYIRALHAGACREPELRSTRVELDRAHRVIKGNRISKTRKFCCNWRIWRTNYGRRPP